MAASAEMHQRDGSFRARFGLVGRNRLRRTGAPQEVRVGAGQLLLELDRVVQDADAGRADHEATEVQLALLRAADDRILQARFLIGHLLDDLDDATVADLEVALVALGATSTLVLKLMKNADQTRRQIALATIAGSSRERKRKMQTVRCQLLRAPPCQAPAALLVCASDIHTRCQRC